MGRKLKTLKLRYDIASRRAKLGLTQKELAERAGVTQSALSCWERGFWDPTKNEQIRRINTVLSAKIRRRSYGE